MEILDIFSNTIRGIFLLLLTLLSSFYVNFLGPNIHNIIYQNIFISNLLLFSLIYFAITLTKLNEGNFMIHPKDEFLLTFFIYIFFLLLGKCEYYCTLIVLVLLLLCYTNYNFIKYAQKKNNLEEHIKLKKLQNLLYILIIAVLFIGFTIYFHKYFIKSKNKNISSLIQFLFRIPPRD